MTRRPPRHRLDGIGVAFLREFDELAQGGIVLVLTSNPLEQARASRPVVALRLHGVEPLVSPVPWLRLLEFPENFEKLAFETSFFSFHFFLLTTRPAYGTVAKGSLHVRSRLERTFDNIGSSEKQPCEYSTSDYPVLEYSHGCLKDVDLFSPSESTVSNELGVRDQMFFHLTRPTLLFLIRYPTLAL